MKNLSIAKQLAIGFGLLLAFLIGMNIFSIQQQDKIGALIDTMFKHPFAVTNSISRVDVNTAHISRIMRDITLSNDEAEIQKFIAQVDNLERKIFGSGKN